MELRQLKSLCLIAQHGTVRETAKRSFLTPSAVSLQIKTLESELGIKIFERSGKRLVLTQKGEVLYQDAQRILESVREAIEKTAAQTHEFTGKITIGAPACLRNFYLPAIVRFRSVYPSIRLTILARSHWDAPSTVYSGEADLAIGLFDQLPSDLEQVPLVAPKLKAVVPHNHPLAFTRGIRMRELTEYPLVLLQPSTTTRKVIDGAFRKKGLSVKLGMEASTCSEIKRYVSSNIGVGIVHDICIDPDDISCFRSKNIARLFSHPEAKLIFRRSKTLSGAEKNLVEFLKGSSQFLSRNQAAEIHRD